MPRPQFPQLQLYLHLGQQNRLWLSARNVDSSRTLSPPSGWKSSEDENPVFSLLACLLTPSGIPRQELGSGTESAQDWDSMNTRVVLPKSCLLSQSVFWQSLFSPWWRQENRGLQGRSVLPFSPARG